MDYAAELDKEIGSADAAGSAPPTIVFRTNVNMLALRAAADRAAPVDPSASPARAPDARRRHRGNTRPLSTVGEAAGGTAVSGKNFTRRQKIQQKLEQPDRQLMDFVVLVDKRGEGPCPRFA